MDDNRIAWHAGRSKWKNFNNLNSKSIGIELVNKGTKFGYQNFSKLQIKSLIIVCKKLKKKYHINQNNFLGHSDIAPLRKNDPGKKFPWKKLSAFKIGTWYKLKKTDDKFIDVAKVRNSFFKNFRLELLNDFMSNAPVGLSNFFDNSKQNKFKSLLPSSSTTFIPERFTDISLKIKSKEFL